MKTPSPKQAEILAKRPDAIAWYGGECPVDTDSNVAVFLTNDGPTGFYPASDWYWHVRNYGDDIIAYIPEPEFAAKPETVNQHCPNCEAREAIKRPSRQEARVMLAAAYYVIQRDYVGVMDETRPPLKAILDAIAGEE
jgi:hypothetical protein